MEDLNKASLEDVQDFFKRYYAPNNATIAIVGDFKSADVMAKMEKYFGSIPSQPAPPQPDVPSPSSTASAARPLKTTSRKSRASISSTKCPGGNSPDIYALDVLGDVLAAGQSSRLYQKLVKDQEIAASSGRRSLLSSAAPSLKCSSRSCVPAKTPAEVEEIHRGGNQAHSGCSPSPIRSCEKIRMRSSSNQIKQLRGSLSRAMELSEDAVFYNDPGRINTYEEHIQKVTKEDIQRVAKKYLAGFQQNRGHHYAETRSTERHQGSGK